MPGTRQGMSDSQLLYHIIGQDDSRPRRKERRKRGRSNICPLPSFLLPSSLPSADAVLVPCDNRDGYCPPLVSPSYWKGPQGVLGAVLCRWSWGRMRALNQCILWYSPTSFGKVKKPNVISPVRLVDSFVILMAPSSMVTLLCPVLSCPVPSRSVPDT